MTKLGCSIAMDEKRMWSDFLKDKYLGKENVFEVHLKRGASRVWRGILSARGWLQGNCCYKKGNGISIIHRKLPWSPELLDGIPRIRQGVNLGDI